VYLHSERKIHRDIKAANVLIAADGSIRVADFGVSVQLTVSVDKRRTFVGSPYWMAPEVIAQTQYGERADVWSLGITAIELATGLPPLSELHPMKAVMFIPRNPPPLLPDDGAWGKKFLVSTAERLSSTSLAETITDVLVLHVYRVCKRCQQIPFTDCNKPYTLV
jgi:serine/threonine protein kinase